MIELNIRLVRSFDEFSSPGGAIAAARRGVIFADELRRRPRIEAVAAAWDTLWLECDGSFRLRLSISACGCVECAPWQDVLPQNDESIPDRMLLKFSEEQCVSDRTAWLNAFRGRRLLKLQLSPPALFMYVEELPTILLMPLRIVETGKMLLDWSEVD